MAWGICFGILGGFMKTWKKTNLPVSSKRSKTRGLSKCSDLFFEHRENYRVTRSAKAYLLSNLIDDYPTIHCFFVFEVCYVCGSSLVLKERAGLATALWEGHQDVLCALPPCLTWQQCVYMLFKSKLVPCHIEPRHLGIFLTMTVAPWRQ